MLCLPLERLETASNFDATVNETVLHLEALLQGRDLPDKLPSAIYLTHSTTHVRYASLLNRSPEY